LSHCVGNAIQQTFGQVGAGILKPDDPDFDRGNCAQDRRHIGNLTVGIQTPQFSSAPLRIVASDWNVSGIFSARSGPWLTITTARDIALTGISAQRVNAASDDVYGTTLNDYLKASAFSFPAPGTLGDVPRGSVAGPAYWSIDLALARLIALGGSRNIELRLETFNLTNHFNWGLPNVSLDSPVFGRIQTQTGSPRVLQFGIKYAF
jgi:hypothetical protein